MGYSSVAGCLHKQSGPTVTAVIAMSMVVTRELTGEVCVLVAVADAINVFCTVIGG